MSDVLRSHGGGFTSAGPYQGWLRCHAQGRYTEVVRAWSEARVDAAFAGWIHDLEAIEAVGWSLALTKSWAGYTLFRADLVDADSNPSDSRRPLLASLDAWRAIHEGRYDAGVHEARAARAAALAPGSPARALAYALRVEGVALFRLGRYVEAEAATRRAADLFEMAHDPLELSHCATNLGLILNARGLFREARAELQRSVAALVQVDAAGERIALAQVNLAVVELHLGHIDSASTLFQSAREVFEAHELIGESITALNGLGHCARAQGRFDDAEALHRQALQLVDTDHARQLGLCHEFLGQLAFDRGQWKRAERHYERALEVAAAIAPDGDLMLEVCWHMAELLTETGKLEPAQESLQRAEALCAASEERRELGSVQRVRARWLARAGHAHAREAFEIALTTLESTGKALETALTRLAVAQFEARRGDVTAAASFDRAAAAFEAIAADSAWLERIALERELAATGSHADTATVRWGFVTRDPEMVALLDALPEIATTAYSVLLEGESGTGKEVLARALHETGGRTGAFVAVNCAAIPRDLFESELFGHVRGAYSGAAGEKIGLIEHADCGTLLLDEIGDMPAEMQAKLLRFLDDGCVRRVGDVRERHVQVKIVAATNRALHDAVERGGFRRDLYHRLATHPLRIKPLRERVTDIEPLVIHLLSQEGLGARVALTPEVLADLEARPWAGNVRELRNHLLGLALGGRSAAVATAPRASLRTSRSSHERRTIEAALAAHAVRVPNAARMLGLHVTTLRRKMRALGIERSGTPVA